MDPPARSSSRSFPAGLTLRSGHVLLRPLSLEDVPVLEALAQATPEAFAWTTTPRDPEASRAYFAKAFGERDAGSAFPFAVVRDDVGQVVGTTRFQGFERAHGRCGIGHTWYAPAHHRDGTNRLCKVLMLDHAFGEMGVRRVQFETDAGNVSSRRSLERLGAVQEGLLRAHRVAPDGTVRDSVLYSILAPEWDAVRPTLRLDIDAAPR
jgi:N-acetyltransferase